MMPQIIPEERAKAIERWTIVLPNLKKNLNEIAYDTWIPEIQPVTYHGDVLYLAIPQLKIGGFLEISQQITSIITQVFLNNNLRLEILPLEDLDQIMQGKKEEGDTIIGDYVFDNFVVGTSNREAYRLAQGIASREEYIKESNPLFIYGASGLGKTHLLYAIYNETKKKFPRRKVCYCPGETWLNEFLDSLSGKQKEFKEKYRSLDLLIIDDVQFIAAKTSTQEELFYTFNELYTNKKQIVFTSDRPPASLSNIGDRLISRFQSGVVIDVKSPDIETRMAIINKKVLASGVDIPQAYLNLVAEHFTDNVRVMEGMVNRLITISDLADDRDKKDKNNDKMLQVIQEIVAAKEQFVPTKEMIIKEVCEFYKITEEEIRGTGRSQKILVPRNIAIYLIRHMVNKSLIEIGNEFSGRDHTTIMNSLNSIEKKMDKDPGLKATVQDIRTNINSKFYSE